MSCSYRSRGWAATLGLSLMLALGCASPGPPRPPSLHLPEQATKLEARRVGGEVLLTWLTPPNTTDGDKVRGGMTAVVCREIAAVGAGVRAAGTACDPVRRVAVTVGPASVVETLPPTLSSGPGRLLAYRVELLNDHGRSAGRGDPVYAAGGEAPPAVGSLTISARRGAGLIQWQPQRYEGAMELKRSLTATAGGRTTPNAGPSRAATPRKPAGALKNQRVPPAGGAGRDAGEVTFTAGGGLAGGSGDPGGMLDRTVRDGDSYVYVAQRVRRITLGGHEVELRGVASPAASFVYRDTFPPGVPVGLVSVPGGGFGVAPSIDLSWEPNSEDDLLGYNVYRREGSGAFTRLNGELLGSSAFRDMSVQPGHRYAYRVTAVDRRRNESAPSGEIHESLRQ